MTLAGNDPIDLDCLTALARDTAPTLVPELAEVFLSTGRERIAVLNEALAAGDGAAAAKQAHALKSSAATFGARHVRTAAAQVESAGLAGDVARLSKDMADLETAWSGVEGCLMDRARAVAAQSADQGPPEAI